MNVRPTKSKEETPSPKEKNPQARRALADLVLNIGSSNRVAPNHIVGALTEYTGISSKSIGRIDISDEYSIVGVPANQLDEILLTMQGCKICGKPVSAMPLADPYRVKGGNSRFSSNRKARKLHLSGAKRKA
jgi:ATP-dependent RNA helicase DeaD